MTRENWNMKDYSLEQRIIGKTERTKSILLWKTFTSGTHYNAPNLSFIESMARIEFHGDSIENKLHLGIYQVGNRSKICIRKKKFIIDGKKKLLPLTSQNHIYPDSKVGDKSISYHPENIREGHALFNGYISDNIDPIFDSKTKKLSLITTKIFNKHNFFGGKKIEENETIESKKFKLTELESHVTFKYFGDRIVSSNMVKKLNTSLKNFYEAPELGIMEGPENLLSMQAYSFHLYKIFNSAGDLSNLDPAFKKVQCSGDISE